MVIIGDRLEFEVLQQRIHPATSRVNRLERETPASFIAFDILARGNDDYTQRPFAERRALLVETMAGANPPIHLAPVTTDYRLAQEWFDHFEGAGPRQILGRTRCSCRHSAGNCGDSARWQVTVR